MHFGIALPMAINLPFKMIESAAVKTYADGSGNIPLQLCQGERVSYIILWPHARPWCFSQPQPMLRAIPAANDVGQLIAQALKQSLATNTPKAVSISTAVEEEPILSAKTRAVASV